MTTASNISWETDQWANMTSEGGFHDNRDPISAEAHHLFSKYWVGLNLLICTIGMSTNIVNIRNFLKMGIGDTVTITFFALAMTDMLYLTSACFAAVTNVLIILAQDMTSSFPWLPVHPFAIFYFVGTVATTFKELSMYITTFLAIQRSLCVIRPLHFKSLFTPFRVIVVITLIWAHNISLTAVLFSHNSLVEAYDHVTNSSTLVLYFKPGFQEIVGGILIYSGLIMNAAREAVVIVSVFIMYRVLNKSAKFRSKTSSSSTSAATVSVVIHEQVQNSFTRTVKNNDGQRQIASPTSASTLSSAKNKSSSSSSTNSLSSKEKQVVMQVAIICAIFLVCNTPFLLISVARTIFTDFMLHGVYHYTFATLAGISATIELINASVNFFVYYKYNSKFKKMLFNTKADKLVDEH